MTHIVKLTAENFKRLVAVEIEPSGRIVPITGKNGEGKTSVLDAITAALVGQKDFKLDQPIRQGEEEAFVEVDLGDFIATRRWRGERSQLEVRLASGAAVPQARRVLDDLIGKLSFDPLGFAQADPKEQRRLLLEVAGLTDQDAAIQQRRQGHYDARTVHNRDVKRLKSQLDGLPRPTPELADAQPVDVSALAAELSQLQAENAAFEHARNQISAVRTEIARLEQRLAELREQEAGLLEKGRTLHDMTRAGRIEQIQSQLGKASAINEAADRKARREEVAKEHDAALEAAKKAADEIAAADEERARLLASADLPIAGLGVDDDGVLLNGVPFSQSSAAERLRTSVAMAMAMNPKLRVIRIADASLLDSVNRALIEQMAEENDFQIWLEVVDETKAQGFVIEDGQVVHHG